MVAGKVPESSYVRSGAGSPAYCSVTKSCPALWVAPQASLSFTNSQSLLKFMSMKSVILSNHLILCHALLLCPQSFPALGSFPMSWLLASGDQSIGASASATVLPMNIPLGLTGLISLKSQVTLKSLFQHHNLKVSILWCSPFFMVQLSTWLMEKPWGFPGGTSGKEPACQCRRRKKCKCDPWSGRSCGGGHGNRLQHSCLENPMDRGAWRAKFIGFQRTGHNWSDFVCMSAR